MQPNEALGIAAQVAVTLAGFAGVVVVFRPQSIHEWAAIDRLRLRLLLHNSVCPLAFALFGMLLLTMKPTPEWIWRSCSLFALLFQLPGMMMTLKSLRTLTPREFGGGSRALFYTMGLFGIATQILQLFNIALLNLFWPFFLSVVLHLMTGILQFMRMVLLLPEKAQPSA